MHQYYQSLCGGFLLRSTQDFQGLFCPFRIELLIFRICFLAYLRSFRVLTLRRFLFRFFRAFLAPRLPLVGVFLPLPPAHLALFLTWLDFHGLFPTLSWCVLTHHYAITINTGLSLFFETFFGFLQHINLFFEGIYMRFCINPSHDFCQP